VSASLLHVTAEMNISPARPGLRDGHIRRGGHPGVHSAKHRRVNRGQDIQNNNVILRIGG
jgi:hypothetical protein